MSLKARGPRLDTARERFPSPGWILLSLWVFHAVNNYIWLSLDQAIAFDDEAFHALGGLQCLELFQRPSLTTLRELMEFVLPASHPVYPPLVHICMGLFNMVGGTSLLVSKLVNLLFLAVLLYAVYGIGKRVATPSMGLFAAFLVSMYPYVVGLSRSTQTDFALTAMVALSLYCLILTEGFTRREPSLFFGIFLGLGMLTKQAFLFFLLPAFLVSLVEIWRASRPTNRNQLANVAYALLIAAVIAGSWYLSQLKHWLSYFMFAAYGKGASPGTPSTVLSIHSFLYFGWQLFQRQIHLIFSLLFLVGLVILCREQSRWKWYWLWSLIVPYVTFSLFLTKHPNYTVPYLPVVAIISAGAVWKIRQVKTKRVVVGILVLFGFVQYVAFSYFLAEMDTVLKNASVRLKAPAIFDVLGPGAPFYPQGLRPLQTRDPFENELRQLLTVLEQEQPVRGTSRIVVLEQGQRGLLTNYPMLDYYCHKRKFRVEVVPRWYWPELFLPDLFVLNGEFQAVVPETFVQHYAKEYVLLRQLPGVYVYKRKKQRDAASL